MQSDHDACRFDTFSSRRRAPLRRSAHARAFSVATSAFALAAVVTTWSVTSDAAPGSAVYAFSSAALERSVPVAVVVPDGYEQGASYPLVLLLHGAGGSEQTWLAADEGDAVSLAARHPAVYVTFDAEKSFYSDWYNGGARGAPAYERFIFDELLPFVQGAYRVLPSREHHAVMGVSMGGYGAMLLASRRPDFFGRAISLSGFVHPGQPSTYLGLAAAGVDAERIWGPYGGPYLEGHDPKELVGNLASVILYLAAGDGIPTEEELAIPPARLASKIVDEIEVRAQAEQFVDAAERAGAHVTWRPRHGVHGWTSWRHDLDDVLAFGLTGSALPAPSSWTYHTVAQEGQAWDIGFFFEAPPPVVQRFEKDGALLRGEGSGAVTLTAGGCTVRVDLPFDLVLPVSCGL